MIRSVVNTAVLRPGLACLQARGMSRAKPIYYNPADADLAEEKQFDVEYGIREDIPERGPLEMIHKWEYVARGVDPWFRFKARVRYNNPYLIIILYKFILYNYKYTFESRYTVSRCNFLGPK